MENAQEKPRLAKLNYNRTFIIGLAFFSIMMMWNVYNTYCPVFLTELLTARLNEPAENVQWIVGILMALDNVFAIFMLPIFGYLSDKTKSKYGKRMPYIVIGTLCAVLVLPCIPIFYAYDSLLGVILMMGLTLIIMNIYRNPAVALMPDITPKPLRAKANGIINFVGYLGGIVSGVIAMFISYKKYSSENKFMLIIPFIIASVFMILSVILLFFRIKENKLAEETKEQMEIGEKMSETVNEVKDSGASSLSKSDKRALWLIIIAVFLWFVGFNAVETFWSSYATLYLNSDISQGSIYTIVLTISSLITFIPAGWLSTKIGRKYTIMIGILLIIVALTSAYFIKDTGVRVDGEDFDTISVLFFPVFIAAGIGWAMINVCSYPMVVEYANKSNLGKYTGVYYTASMLAQSITPIFVGFLFKDFGWNILCLYTAFFMLLAFIVFIFVKTKKPVIHK